MVHWAVKAAILSQRLAEFAPHEIMKTAAPTEYAENSRNFPKAKLNAFEMHHCGPKQALTTELQAKQHEHIQHRKMKSPQKMSKGARNFGDRSEKEIRIGLNRNK